MKLRSIILFLCCALLSVKSIAQTNNGEVAEKFIKALAADQYDQAAALFDPSITQVNQEVLKTAWQQITGMFGPYQSHYFPLSADHNALSMTMGVRFKKSTQGFSCNFNEKHQLVGFLLAAAPQDPDAKVAVEPSHFQEQNVSIPVDGGAIKGSLMLPNNVTAQTPVALIIAGSGATDRNGNGAMIHTNAYKMLAEALAESGIASLRYDKRLVGESKDFDKDESKLRFENYVSDAEYAIAFLKKNKGYTKVFIIGHSEGSLIGILAAQKEKINAFVSLCGGGENIANTLKRQMPGVQAAAIIDELKNGQLTNDVPQELAATFRASVQPYLVSWMKYDPAVEIKKLNVPVMIIGGTTDIQVPVADAEMLKRAVPKAELLIVNGMNHVLKDAPEDKTANIVTYNQPDLPLNKELVAGITRFLAQK